MAFHTPAVRTLHGGGTAAQAWGIQECCAWFRRSSGKPAILSADSWRQTKGTSSGSKNCGISHTFRAGGRSVGKHSSEPMIARAPPAVNRCGRRNGKTVIEAGSEGFGQHAMQAKDTCAPAGNDSGTVCQPTGRLSGRGALVRYLRLPSAPATLIRRWESSLVGRWLLGSTLQGPPSCGGSWSVRSRLSAKVARSRATVASLTAWANIP